MPIDCDGNGSMDQIKIVGILLVRNEDLFFEQVVKNILDFCDRVIIADHRSRDGTREIAQFLVQSHQHVEYHRIGSSSASHDLIKGYAGRNIWLFGVDGDELYDPDGLCRMRRKLLSRAFQDQWMILGNVLNVVDLDRAEMTADGYLAPPCRSMTKLYNFSAIQSWNGLCDERLHGGRIEFKKGFDRSLRCELFQTLSWKESYFRCLHLCFLPRSSKENWGGKGLFLRRNIAEKKSQNLYEKGRYFFSRLLGKREDSQLKREKYMRGNLSTHGVQSFFRR